VRLPYTPTCEVVLCRDEKSQHKNKAIRILQARLLEAERDKQNVEISGQRKSRAGTGERIFRRRP